MTIQASRPPRLTASRHGFLARSTALSWPWNKDRILAAPGTLPPTFADLALGVADCRKPIIRVGRKDPLQREDDFATGERPLIASAQNPSQREDDGGDLRSKSLPLPLREGAGGGVETPPNGDHPTPPPNPLPQGEGENPAQIPSKNPIQRERTGPLRNGNPRGNPNLAPRCGARTRRTGCPCRAPAMRNGKCRLHGGKSTGPRTEEGRARIRAARTRHGRYTAESRAFQRDIIGLLRRSRELLSLARQPGPVDADALRHLAPPDFGKHPMQRETPPATRSAAPAAPDKHLVHRENPGPAANAGAIWVHPCSSVVESLPPAPHPGSRPYNSSHLPSQATPPPPPAAAARRPILLARPRPVAT